MQKNNTKSQRMQFATRLGVLAATVGSSVGLGNIWRFPYEAGNNGGGAFMLCYIGFIILIGIPVISAEFVLGRQSRSDFFGCFARLGERGGWRYMGIIGILASLMILSFYSVVAGWTLEYFFQALTGNLAGGDGDAAHYSTVFQEFSAHSWRPLMWTVLFLLINHLVVKGGVQKGIERVSNILMPLLFAILVALAINSLFLPKASEGLAFLFRPDSSALTPAVVLSALGQAFFSLSIGLGCMLTYASYFSDRTNLLRSASITAGLDTVVAILAGVLIFPAVYSFGASPEAGPTLVFAVLPSIFHSMPGGAVISVLFFLMLFVASLTSTISMSEISIAYFVDERKQTRSRACNISTAIAMLGGILCTLSFSGVSNITIGSFTFNFFDFFNNATSNLLLPVGGMLISIYVGWRLKPSVLRAQLTDNGLLRHIPVAAVAFLLRWICPVAIGAVLLSSLGMI